MAKRLSIILLAIIGVITGAYAADRAKAVAYQYWVDTNFGARVTENIVDDDRVVTIPEAYFSGLPNGIHTFYTRAKDANGVWGVLLPLILATKGYRLKPQVDLRYLSRIMTAGQVSQ